MILTGTKLADLPVRKPTKIQALYQPQNRKRSI